MLKRFNDKPLLMSAEEIQAWEEKQESEGKKHRKIKAVKFDSYSKEDGTVFLIARPTRYTLNSVTLAAKKDDFDKANENLINNCVVAGDMSELEEDEELYYGLIEEIGKLAEGKKKIS